MTMSSTIQEVVLEFLSDKQEHSVQDIKHYLREQDVRDYTEGQFAGSLNTLMRNGSIKKVQKNKNNEKLTFKELMTKMAEKLGTAAFDFTVQGILNAATIALFA